MAIDVVLSLDSYEKKLLESFQHAFFADGARLTSDPRRYLDCIINRWNWPRRIAHDYDLISHNNGYRRTHQGDRRIMWKMLLKRLDAEFESGDRSCHSKLSRLLEDNPLLEQHFSATAQNLQFIPAPGEERYWDVVVNMALVVQWSMRDLTKPELASALLLPTADFTFPQDVEGTPGKLEIWSLVRSSGVLCRSNNGSLNMVREALQQCGFRDNNITKRGNTSALTGAVTYLEYIPWGHLRISDAKKLLWRPEKSVSHDHHLRSEEEVFKFCVDQEFYFPNHMEDDSIVFIPSPLKDSKLLNEMWGFWNKWNDCAITYNPNAKEWYLLETIPGIQFRKLWNEQGQVAGLNYFRRVVDDYRYGRVSMLKDVLGLDAPRSRYEGLLEVIPFSEITSVDPNPLGGSNGFVYHAEWICPQKINMAAPERRHVALKTMKDDREKNMQFLNELDATFSALQGRPVMCIQFYGVTKTPSNDNDKAPFLRPDALFLVFEWAKMGSLLDHLQENLTGEPRDWETILRFMGDLAEGIRGLHKHKIIHRDTHGNNILITSVPKPNDPYLSESINLVVTDLGEGHASDSEQSLGRRYYGNPEFWAPEVKRSHKYSFASDIYAVGYVMADMIKARWRAVIDKTGREDRSVPQCMLDLVTECISPQAEERPTADALADNIESYHFEYMTEGEDGAYCEIFPDIVEVPEGYLTHAPDGADEDNDGIPF